MTQPLLDLPSRRTILMSVGRKVLAETMQNPMLAHRGVRTRDGLSVLDALALATVQATLECNHLEPANQMTIGLTVLPENQGRPVLTCRQLGDQLVGDWDDTLFAILRLESEVGLLPKDITFFSALMSECSATLASASRIPVPRRNRQRSLSSSEDTRNKSSSSWRVYASGGCSTYLILMLTSVTGGPARRPSLFRRNVMTCVMRFRECGLRVPV